MSSPYANRVEQYGVQWHRPWLVCLGILIAFLASAWFTRKSPYDAHVFCLKPSPESNFRPAVDLHGLFWTADLQAALARAHKSNRLVLVAFHGVTDMNARVNEVQVFAKPNLKRAMKRHVLVMLYVDIVPDEYYAKKSVVAAQKDDAAVNLKFQTDTFDTVQEPLYAVLRPMGGRRFQVVGVYDEARINDADRFADFVRHPHLVENEPAWRRIITLANRLSGRK